MSIALDVYQAFKDDETKAKVLAEAFERIEQKIREAEARQKRYEELRRQAELELEVLRARRLPRFRG